MQKQKTEFTTIAKAILLIFVIFIIMFGYNMKDQKTLINEQIKTQRNLK